MVGSVFQHTAPYEFGVPQDAKVGLTDMIGPSVLVSVSKLPTSAHGLQMFRLERGPPQSELI